MGYLFTEPDSKGAQLKGALLATLTNQSEVVPDPSTDDTFVGLRAIVDFVVPFGPEGKSSFTSRLALDENLQTTDDFRSTWWNSLSVSMTDRFAMQVSLGVVYDNQPALSLVTALRVRLRRGPRRPRPLGNVFVPLKKWDREFSVSLVLNLVPKKPTPPPPPPCAPCK